MLKYTTIRTSEGEYEMDFGLDRLRVCDARYEYGMTQDEIDAVLDEQSKRLEEDGWDVIEVDEKGFWYCNR